MDRRTLFCDVDETLICHNLSDFHPDQIITVCCNGRSFDCVPHTKNINLLTKFWRLGYDVYVWSKTGKSWAEAVVEKLELSAFVTACLSKPDFLLDDKDVATWIGQRVYRDPKTGAEQ